VHILHTEASIGWGGQEIRILTEAAGMQLRGHEIEIACPAESRLFAEAARYGVRATALPIGRKRPAGLLALRRFVAGRRLDVINAHSSTDAWLGALARGGTRKVPALVRTRHISAPVAHDALTRWLYTRATAEIVTTGETIRRQLIEDLHVAPERVTSIPTGIDAVRFRPRDSDAARQSLGLPAAVPVIGIVATLRSWKGHRYLIDALPRLKHRDAMLVMVGEGPQRDALQEQVTALGLGERVKLAGNQNDVAPWLAALDVFALPSYANEGVPQALLQAMFVGVPCVTTDAGAIGEVAIADKTALVVAKENAQALADGIDALLANRQRARSLAHAARELALSRFGFDSMLDRMETVFLRASRERDGCAPH